MKALLIFLGVGLLVAASGALVRYVRSPRIVILGREEAMADVAERRRLERAKPEDPSPLPSAEYDRWKGELRLFRTAPVPLDFALAAACRELAMAPADDRARARSRISKGEFYTLLTFAQRSALFGMRQEKVSWIRDGLAAMALIERERIDYRNIPLVLSLLHHAASSIGAQPDRLLAEAAALAEPNVSILIQQFVTSAPEDKQLDAWGFRQVSGAAGPDIVGWSFSEFAPTTDLTAAIIDASEIIERDQYLAESVALGADLPEVWLQSRRAEPIPELKNVRAGASLRGALKPPAHESHEAQQLLLFVVELEDDVAVARLLERATGLRPKHYALLVIGRGHLVAVLVGSSFVEGVAAFETTERLGRFRPALEAILTKYAG